MACFPMWIVVKRWKKYGGTCEGCGKSLCWDNRGRYGRGKWEAHSISGLHRPTISDCRILCWDCHRDTF